jgi:hypothetical protein
MAAHVRDRKDRFPRREADHIAVVAADRLIRIPPGGHFIARECRQAARHESPLHFAGDLQRRFQFALLLQRFDQPGPVERGRSMGAKGQRQGLVVAVERTANIVEHLQNAQESAIAGRNQRHRQHRLRLIAGDLVVGRIPHRMPRRIGDVGHHALPGDVPRDAAVERDDDFFARARRRKQDATLLVELIENSPIAMQGLRGLERNRVEHLRGVDLLRQKSRYLQQAIEPGKALAVARRGVVGHERRRSEVGYRLTPAPRPAVEGRRSKVEVGVGVR